LQQPTPLAEWVKENNVWKWLKTKVSEFIEIEAANWEAAQRGTLTGILPAMIVMGAAMAAKKIAANRAANKAGKEQKRVGEANAQANFETQSTMESNREDDRINRMGFLASQLKGARALSPEAIQAALTRRKSAVRKGATLDPTKGLGWSLAGDLAGTVGDVAGMYIKGSGGSAPTSLRPPIGSGSAGNCPPGMQSDGGGCY
jgi:hypothetical protein